MLTQLLTMPTAHKFPSLSVEHDFDAASGHGQPGSLRLHWGVDGAILGYPFLDQTHLATGEREKMRSKVTFKIRLIKSLIPLFVCEVLIF